MFLECNKSVGTSIPACVCKAYMVRLSQTSVYLCIFILYFLSGKESEMFALIIDANFYAKCQSSTIVHLKNFEKSVSIFSIIFISGY